VVPLGSPGERLTQLRVESDRLDAGGGRADRWATAPAAERLVDVVARLGLVGELLDELVGDRLAAYLGRIFIAWITASEPSSRTIVTTSSRSALRAGPR
jgi:hypothetical protein